MKKYDNHSNRSNGKHDEQNPRIMKMNYHVTSQTAYHIRSLAMESNTSEGRIIDKLVRNYLAERGTYSNKE